MDLGLFSKKKVFGFSGKLIEAENTSMPIGAYFSIALNDDLVTISNSNLTFNLQKAQIIYSSVSFETTDIMKNTNVVGRGLVGAALMGSTGAAIGSASAIGSRKGVSISHHVHIQFHSTAGNECRLCFSVDEFEFRNADKFSKEVNPSFQSINL